jgi:hypothetical protein
MRWSEGPGPTLPAGDDTRTVSAWIELSNGGCAKSLNRVPPDSGSTPLALIKSAASFG